MAIRGQRLYQRLGSGHSADVVQQLRGLMRNAVKDWLMSDVAVGCSLSGGMDSTAIVGLMAGLGIHPIRTWTLGFEEACARDLDERHLARPVAKRFQTDHHEIIIRAKSVLNNLEQMVWHLDEPYAGGSPSWFVFREMSKEVKVAMTGTGGDELFGNYGKWRVHRLNSLGWVKTMLRRIHEGGLRNLFHYPHGTLCHGYFGERQKKSLWITHHRQDLEGTLALIEKIWQEVQTDDPRNAVSCIDFQLQLPEEFLLMTDRFAMAWSLEARTPFLDHRVIEFVLKLPARLRTDKRELKKRSKEVMRDLLPKELLSARKHGFVLPINQWLRGRLRPMVEELLRRQHLKQQGLFSTDVYDCYVPPHVNQEKDHSWQIWNLLMFQLWCSQKVYQSHSTKCEQGQITRLTALESN